MVLQLRKSVAHTALLNMAGAAGIGLALLAFAKENAWSGQNLAVLLLLAITAGVLAGWRKLRSMAQAVINGIPKSIALAQLRREQVLEGVQIDWPQLDDYAAQLQAAGFVHLGDFTNHPPFRSLTGVATVFCDRAGSILIEIQFIRLSRASEAASGREGNGIHFSLCSFVGGHIRITTTDHRPTGVNYVLRSPNDVMAAFPGESLLSLLDKHRRLLRTVCERTGMQASKGLNMTRYVLLLRERFDIVRERLRGLGAYRLIGEIDQFDAQPVTSWALPAAVLATLPVRTLDALDASPQLQTGPAVVAFDAAMPGAGATARIAEGVAGPEAAALGSGEIVRADAEEAQALASDHLQRKVGSAAGWFYWIAAMSVLNLLAMAAGSTWNFALGLGFSQLLFQQGGVIYQHGGSVGAMLVMYLGSLGSIAFMVACGYFARKPSRFVFSVGLACLALDTVILLLAGDVAGILLHALALCFLYSGLRAARVLRAMQLQAGA